MVLVKRWIAVAILLFAAFAPAQKVEKQSKQRVKPALAARPPLGWNSWDSYGLRIDEQQFRDNVKVLTNKLKPFGYDYAVIDEGWFLRNPESRPHPELLQYELDANGRYIPVPSRFPSATAGTTNVGFAPIGKWLHAQGLKFGIHIVRGIPRESVKRDLSIEGSTFKLADAADQSDACPWDPTNWGVKDTPAGQAWYDALLRQYAVWGVDFLKVDCISNNPYKVSEIRQIRLAIQHAGRPMVLSLSPGPTSVDHAEEVIAMSQMWRISNDVWDVWSTKAPFPKSVKDQFAQAAKWSKYAGPGHWPDADMLPIGELTPYPDVGKVARHTRLTPAEQRTMVTLWSFARSPLMVGANLTQLDEPTTALLTNRNLLRIDQNAIASREVRHDGETIVWTSDLPNGQFAVAAFNIGDEPADGAWQLSDLGLPAGSFSVRDAWEGTEKGSATDLKVHLEPHATAAYVLTRNHQ
ncbi:alpha-galactosidase [Terriglobus roseus DSM 18391]|uniref:Alpha-galactosidase n=1 Tax=Terriglobus roseus (strain DSM 18391 / NRRL B-41598 / KBS 63) TaxID=926566 RepID=I3ZFP9_TERRK|nr:glycoside hydrolase family 27 protein [Terriglobus roseus]AFL88067.1 alpha-galactosidase [Terriglobus roseus DSM 18391]